MIGVGVGTPGGGAIAPTPLTILGGLLVGWWNADSASKITVTGSGVSSWKDEIGGYDLTQATDAARPTWSPTSFNGRAGVTFDGVDDFLRLNATPGTFPVGNASSEIWIAGAQDQDKNLTAATTAFGYGSGSTATRLVRRTVTSADNRAGLNAQGTSTINTSGIWLGRHLVRACFVDAACTPHFDGVAGPVGGQSLATVSGNVTAGATTAASANGFFGGTLHQVLVLGGTPSSQAIAELNALLIARL
ncbi:MAG: hypothetical protein K1X35_09950 [Caulobacteraceae bacterium]|nr:hypothetical protein [Caulobacteraceae bacterium]